MKTAARNIFLPSGRHLYRIRLTYRLDGEGSFSQVRARGIRALDRFEREDFLGADPWEMDPAIDDSARAFWLYSLIPATDEQISPLLARLAAGAHRIFGESQGATEEVQVTFEGLVYADETWAELLAAGVIADIHNADLSPHLVTELFVARDGAKDLLTLFPPPVYDGGAAELVEAFGADVSPAFDAFAAAIGDLEPISLSERERPAWLPERQ